VAGTELLVTGEGRLDDQSFHGKVVGHLACLAAGTDVPVIAVPGGCTTTTRHDLESVRELVRLAGSLDAALADPTR
jgi:glycerate kinase